MATPVAPSGGDTEHRRVGRAGVDGQLEIRRRPALSPGGVGDPDVPEVGLPDRQRGGEAHVGAGARQRLRLDGCLVALVDTVSTGELPDSLLREVDAVGAGVDEDDAVVGRAVAPLLHEPRDVDRAQAGGRAVAGAAPRRRSSRAVGARRRPRHADRAFVPGRLVLDPVLGQPIQPHRVAGVGAVQLQHRGRDDGAGRHLAAPRADERRELHQAVGVRGLAVDVDRRAPLPSAVVGVSAVICASSTCAGPLNTAVCGGPPT